jgi:quercetin dioxygenase-like cupin family protein
MYQRMINKDEIDFTPLDIPGVRIQVLHKDESTGGMTVLTHIAAGATIPEHWHTSADETVYVLEGDFVERGQSYGPGAFFAGRAGTSHGPHSSVSGCVVLTAFSAAIDFQMGSAEAGV